MNNGIIQYVSIKDLIERLQALAEKHGDDTPVCINGIANIYEDVKPYHWDGGYSAISANNLSNVLYCRRWDEKKCMVKREGFPETVVHLYGITPEEFHSFNGRPVREIDPDGWTYLDEMENEERITLGGQIVEYELLAYDETQGCYPWRAYVKSGESATGTNRAIAKSNLIHNYGLKGKS